jgi:hypothetical protein
VCLVVSYLIVSSQTANTIVLASAIACWTEAWGVMRQGLGARTSPRRDRLLPATHVRAGSNTSRESARAP